MYGSGTAAFANPWGSATTGIATVSTTGLSVGVSVGGPVNITYTNTNGCSSTVQLTVNDNPIISGTNTLCVGSSNVTLTATGGSPSPSPWASSANIVATISTAGVISGVAAGSTNITYTNSGGCSSLVYPITVLAKPTITGSPSLCAGSSITLTGSPTAAAINPWVSDNANVTINGSGFVTAGNSAGSSNITYTNSNGCASLPYSITVNAAPTVSLSAGGPSITTANVCKSSTLQLFGTATAGPSPWASSNNSIATITTGGLITPVVTGTCSITYTNNNTCTKTITFKVDTIPAGPISVTNAIRCGTGSVILSAVAPSGLVIDWFATSSGGAALSGGSSLFATPSINTTTIYYAQTRNMTTGCISVTPRTSVTATISSLGTWLGLTTNWSDGSNWCNGSAPISTDNVTIPSSLTNYPIIPNSTIGICNNITLQTGASLTVTGNGKLTVYGTISNAGTINVSDGTVEFAGTSAQSISSGIFASSNIKNLIINNTSVTLSALSGALYLTGKLSFAGNNRRFVTNNNLVLKSDSATTASVGNIEKDANTNAAITGNTITGKVSVERYISGAKKAWRLLSSPTVHLAQTIKQSWMENGSANNNPVSGYGIQTTSNLPGAISLGFDTISPAGPSIKIYNSAANLWDGIATTNVNFLPGTAYMTFIRGDRSVTRYNQPSKPTRIREKDSLNMNDFTVSSLGSAGGQFASVGNPYASAISLANITRTNLDSTYYLWDPKLGAAADYGGFQTISVVNGVATVTPAGGSYNSGNKYVESGQGFFVRTTTNIGAITFKESNKVDGSYLVARPPVSSFRSFRTNILRVQNGEPNLVDGVVNVYDLSFSNNIDASDAIKFKNSMENISIISASNDLLSIDRRSGINNNDTIFFKLNQLRLSRYQFEFTPEYLDDLGLEAYLEDNYFNTKTPLSLNTTSTIDFDITNDAGSYNPDRFRIVFKVLRPVPVTFVDVKAVKQEKNVLISWRVDNEININKYVVEKSNDGVHFIAIGNKSATGSSTYSFLDEQAIDGVNYYRIRSEGLGGDINYSKVVKVIFESTPSISIYPNPVKEDRTIHLKLHKVQKGIIQIRMINHLGQKVMLKTITHNGGNQEYVISINKSIIHGYYTLEVIDGQNLKTILKLFL